MINSNNNFNSNVANSVSASSSNDNASSFNASSIKPNSFNSSVNSNSSVTSQAPAKTSSKANNNIPKGGIVPLRDRTHVQDVDNTHRNIEITEANGKHIYAQLIAPSFKRAEEINDARYSMIPSGRTAVLRFTTTDYQTKLFSLFHNLEVNRTPVGRMNWGFLNSHERQTASWLMEQADSFLTDNQNSSNE